MKEIVNYHTIFDGLELGWVVTSVAENRKEFSF